MRVDFAPSSFDTHLDSLTLKYSPKTDLIASGTVSALKGYQIYHNFIRPHEGLGGKTPAEACGITVEGRNKWLTIIQNASHVQSLNTDKTEESKA